jgi:type VI protein secretion system component VasF
VSNKNVERNNSRPSTSGRTPTSDELVREAEQKYVEAIAMLSRDVTRRRSRLDAETAARFERTLAAVNRTIADTRRAVRQHPGDPLAAKYMLTAYAKKVDVLREIIGY